jgi:hypothetical protein
VSITIDPVADPPVANDDNKSTPINTAVTIDVAANDTDPDGDLDSSSANSTCSNGSSGCLGAANGTLADNGDGTITYTPDTGFIGIDSFFYEICDSGTSPLCDTASVDITVSSGALTVFEVRVAASSDDAEERTTGRVSLTSGDLELVFDKDIQAVGMRFNGITIPQGANITSAFVQFKAEETHAENTTLSIHGQADSDALTFINSINNIKDRALTTANVVWAPLPWTMGEAGPDQRTPDIASLIQEIVNLTEWLEGNSLVIIITGNETNRRAAESYNGDQAGAPLLHVEYTTGN